MARRVGFVLVFVGLFLLFFGLFERFYAYPRLKKAPLDQYSSPVATGTGTYFNRSPDKLAEVTGAQLMNKRIVRATSRPAPTRSRSGTPSTARSTPPTRA